MKITRSSQCVCIMLLNISERHLGVAAAIDVVT